MARQASSRRAGTSGHSPAAQMYDVAIAGGGYVGLCTAVAIRAAAPSLSVCVVDPQPRDAIEMDVRASAIAAAATRMLERLGLWDELSGDAQPINEMIVTDSRLGDVTRPVFLTFADDATGEEQPFAHMLPNRSLVKALRRRAEEVGVELVQDQVDGFSIEPAGVEIRLGKGRISARLLVAADGVRSKLREQAGIRTVHWPYDQMGIVVTVAHERPHEGRAEEHFLPAGPFAILPLKGN
ncbi:MAG: FAD-dependent monooxygenase, partial [Pseudomonadota bacterium]|nr:FAD-dependent monooxygenase [Pseudomonadota bacterium]